jgi:hypothetical protein
MTATRSELLILCMLLIMLVIAIAILWRSNSRAKVKIKSQEEIRQPPNNNQSTNKDAMPSTPTGSESNIFISYSRRDAAIISGIVRLYEVAEAKIFLDSDSIPAGANWRKCIEQALLKCSAVLVFWCEHSGSSVEVRKEYQLAIALGKRVVPVLMDDSELPGDLSIYQHIDLRESLALSHDSLNSRAKDISFDALQLRAGDIFHQEDAVYLRLLMASKALRIQLANLQAF